MARSARSKRRFVPSSLTLDSRPSLSQFLETSAYFHRAACGRFHCARSLRAATDPSADSDITAGSDDCGLTVKA
jgi:hypothetical protein